ncbi:MAG: carbamoyltransferase C-terminal domain-containing protein [Xanthobacteraceae bacterium]
MTLSWWRPPRARFADGLVVGWFQGRMEWGPRALGNRSILGDPRRADMKTILNVKIKRRESFRLIGTKLLVHCDDHHRPLDFPGLSFPN